MPSYVANDKTADELRDIHQNVHLAINNLTKHKKYDETARILRIVDKKLANLLNAIKTIL